MPNIYVRTGPFDEEPAQGPSGRGDDLWAAFPDVPSTDWYARDPWAVLPDASAQINDAWAAYPDVPSHMAALGNTADPWTAFPNWPPAQVQQGIDADLLAAYPDLHSRFFASQAPGNAAWSANDLSPFGALVAAPRSFSETAMQPTGGDPWAAFPDWPSTQEQPGMPQSMSDPAALSRFYASQALGKPDWSVADLPNFGSLLSAPRSFSEAGLRPEAVSNYAGPTSFDDLSMLRGDAFSRPVEPQKATNQSNQGVPVRLPNGETIPDQKSPTGYLMSPVADLGPVAAAGRQAGETYRSLLSNPETAPSALLYLGASLYANFHQGGIFDYQRQGNWLTGYTQLPQFYPISNVNVGLFAQQAGLTLDETLSIAGRYARLFSKNARPNEPYGLHPVTKKFIETGFNIGERGVFGQPPAP